MAAKSKSTTREFVLITLSHADRREEEGQRAGKEARDRAGKERRNNELSILATIV